MDHVPNIHTHAAHMMYSACSSTSVTPPSNHFPSNNTVVSCYWGVICGEALQLEDLLRSQTRSKAQSLWIHFLFINTTIRLEIYEGREHEKDGLVEWCSLRESCLDTRWINAYAATGGPDLPKKYHTNPDASTTWGLHFLILFGLNLELNGLIHAGLRVNPSRVDSITATLVQHRSGPQV